MVGGILLFNCEVSRMSDAVDESACCYKMSTAMSFELLYIEV